MQKTYLKYFAALLLFGANGIIASNIALSSYEIVFMRTMVGSVTLLLLFFLSRQKFSFYKHKKDLLFLLLSGAGMGASWMFLYEAYAQIGVSIATLVYYSGPVIVMVLSPVLFRERLTWPKIAGFILILSGILCIHGNAALSGAKAWGLFCGIMSAMTYAVMVLANKKSRRITGLQNAAIQLLAGFFTVTVFMACKSGFSLQTDSKSWIWILILGIVNTGLGCYLYFSSIGKLPVQTVAVCGYIEPLSAVLLSAVFLNETMSGLQIAGAVLILGGAAFGEFAFRGKASKLDLSL